MRVVKDRLSQTFKFLKELNNLRNPVPRDLSQHENLFRIDDWPLHPLIQVRRGDGKDDDESEGEVELEPLIRIRRASLTPCPKPPESLDGWLVPGWQSADAEVVLLKTRNFQDKQQGTITVAFDDDQQRVVELNTWTNLRDRWAAAERPAIAARRLFEEIHTLWTTLQREDDRAELVLGDGILEVPAEVIRYPVLLQRLNLQFDPAGPEFRIDPGTEKVELQRALLRLVPSIEARMIAQFDKELETTPVQLLGGEVTSEFLRRLVQGLFAAEGEFRETHEDDHSSARSNIRRSPVIFLRGRTSGLTTTLDHVIEDLEQNDTAPPEGLARIVGIEAGGSTAPSRSANGEQAAKAIKPQLDILFSKPRTRNNTK